MASYVLTFAKRFYRQVHGLGPEDTEDAPVFPFVWEKIAPLVVGLPLVAHIAMKILYGLASVRKRNRNPSLRP